MSDLLLSALDAIHELAAQIADHYGDNWDHTPACMGEPACPLCLILHISGGGTPDEDEIAAGNSRMEAVNRTFHAAEDSADQLAHIDAILARSDHLCEPSFCDWKRDIRDIREVRGL